MQLSYFVSYAQKRNTISIVNCRTYSLSITFCALALICTSPVSADTIISQSQIQNGGTFSIVQPVLYVTHLANNPQLTLTNGAISTNTWSTIIGQKADEEGRILISNGSSIKSVLGARGPIPNASDPQAYYGSVYFGLRAGSTGTATITGANSLWELSDTFMVGFEGTGYFNIENGGTAKSLYGFMGRETGSVGHAQVIGTNSKWIVERGLYVGRLGEGSLTVADGGSVNTAQLLGTLANIQGNGTIAANGIVLDADLHFGSASAQTFTIPFGNGGAINVDLEREVIGASNILGVGFKSTGSMLMDQGANIKSDSGQLGFWPGSQGIATITGNGTRWETGSLSISENGSLLRILNGGAVKAGGVTLGESNSAARNQLMVSGSNSTLTTGSVDFGAGLLTVENGGVVNTKSIYGSLPQIQGNGQIQATGMVFDDIDLRFDNTHGLAQTFAFGNGGQIQLNVDGTGDLGAGNLGNGSLNIRDGVVVSSTNGFIAVGANSLGVAIVSGQGSSWSTNFLNVGYQGTGSLKIEAGAAVSSTWTFIGRVGDGYGELVISGADGQGTPSSLNSTTALQILEGKFRIESGGRAHQNGVTLGNSTTTISEAVVSGNHSTWIIDSSLAISGPNAKVTLEAGGFLQSAGARLGNSNGAQGNIQISGQDSSGNPSTWISQGDFIMGGTSLTNPTTSDSTLTIADHGLLQVSGIIKLFANDTVNLQPGGVVKTNHFNVSQHNGIFNFTGGTLDVSGTFTGNLNVPLTGVFSGTSTITGNLLNAGEIAPGNSPGKLTISGAFTQLALGTLSIELGGTVASTSYDQLAVGIANLDGSLDLSLINGFQLNAGQVFTILTATQINGQFSGLTDGGIAATFGDYNLLIDYQPTQVQLITQVIPEPGVIFGAIVCLVAMRFRRAKFRRVD